MKKKCFLRSNDDEGCPFGLPIPEACKCVGESIDRLCPLESVKEDEEKEAIGKMNRKVYFYTQEGKKCKYSEGVLKDSDISNCNFGDVAEGLGSPVFEGSPFYAQLSSGLFTGLYTSPVSFYTTLDSVYRNAPFGLFSYYGSLHNFILEYKKEIIKIADAYDERGEENKVDKIDSIMERVERGEDIPLEETKEFIELCREDFNRRHVGPQEEQDIRSMSPRLGV